MFPLNRHFAEAIEESLATGATLHPVVDDAFDALGALHDRVFGPGALTRTAYRIREGLPRHTAHCRFARDATGLIMAFIRFAPLRIGGVPGALMLGPLAVAPTHANQGHARRLMAEGLQSAAGAGVPLVILVGDVPYYGKLGFVPVPVGQITMPGPVDTARLLAFELASDALAAAHGMISGDVR